MAKLMSNEELAFMRAACSGSQYPAAMGKLWEHIDALTAECERLRDLVRYQRAELHEAGLITDAEYASLAAAQGSVQRLEGYDKQAATIAGLREALIHAKWSAVCSAVHGKWGQLNYHDAPVLLNRPLPEVVLAISERTGELKENIQEFMGNVAARAALEKP